MSTGSTSFPRDFDNALPCSSSVQPLVATMRYGGAPCGTGGDHVRDALLTPCRVPLHFLDFFQGSGAQRAALYRGFHGDEPLFRGPENDGIMTTPAMRVGVLNFLTVHEHAPLLQ